MTKKSAYGPEGPYQGNYRLRSMYPRDNKDFSEWRRLIDEFIVTSSPVRCVTKKSRFFIQGSCFAENLNNALVEAGYDTYYNVMQEALNSPYANWLHLKELLETKDREAYQRLAQADVFILTIGVAAIWYSKADNGFIYQPDIKRIDDFYQKTLTVKEAKDALLGTLRLIQEINPNIITVLTLSPVPLARTFEFDSGIVADCVSKSILRAAIHELLGPKPYSNLIYFPSFEIVRWGGTHRGDSFGDDGGPRHVSRDVVNEIIAAFLRHYAVEEEQVPA